MPPVIPSPGAVSAAAERPDPERKLDGPCGYAKAVVDLPSSYTRERGVTGAGPRPIRCIRRGVLREDRRYVSVLTSRVAAGRQSSGTTRGAVADRKSVV